MSKKIIKKKNLQKDKKPPKVNISSELHSRFLKRVAFYAFFGLLTLGLTFLVYYRSKGYTFNTSGQVERRGIVLINSSPVESTVFFDGKKIETTETKLEANEGAHSLQLEATGYKTWQHAFKMHAQAVKWYYYPYLIPEKIESESFLSNQTPKLYSPKAISKAQLVALSTSGQNLSLELVNLAAKPEEAVKLIQVPVELFSRASNGQFGQFSFLEWSPDSDSLLIKHSFDQSSELINLRVNNPEQSSNLTRTLAASITQAHFNPDSKLDILLNAELRQYSPTNLSLEQTIATNLTSFKAFEDQTYLYTKNSSTSPGSLELYAQQSSNTPVLISTFSSLDPSQIDYNYTVNRRNGYLTVIDNTKKELQVFKNPFQNQPNQNSVLTIKPALYLATFSELKSAELKVSPTGSSQPGRYIALQLSGSKFFVYDLDKEESLIYNLNTSSGTEEVSTQSTYKELNITQYDWLDPHRLQVQDQSGDIYYLDYDGNYLNLIATGSPLGLSSFVNSKDYSIVITANADASGTQNLTKLKFKVE